MTRGDSIGQLLQKMGDVYAFMTQKELAAIKEMKGVVTQISQQTLECSYLLRDYSKTKTFVSDKLHLD